MIRECEFCRRKKRWANGERLYKGGRALVLGLFLLLPLPSLNKSLLNPNLLLSGERASSWLTCERPFPALASSHSPLCLLQQGRVQDWLKDNNSQRLRLAREHYYRLRCVRDCVAACENCSRAWGGYWKRGADESCWAGAGTVLHPRCTILALSGPIVVGSNCIVEENVVMVNRCAAPSPLLSSLV